MIATTQSEWNGYQRLDFSCEGHDGCVIFPHTPLQPGNRWIWRAEFLGAFDTVDRALLERGWCLTYFHISDMYGCPQAVEWMESFRQLVVSEWNLNDKTVLEGFSRGGLYACNYAAAHPDKVSCLYLDAPLLDIRNWPGGFATNPRQDKEWEDCKRWYGLTDETAKDFHGNPLDKAEDLCRAGIPILLVAGLADKTLEYSENGGRLNAIYERLGGTIHTVLKPDCDHHPHSLADPTELVAFIERVTAE